jgi:hypothetical protein
MEVQYCLLLPLIKSGPNRAEATFAIFVVSEPKIASCMRIIPALLVLLSFNFLSCDKETTDVALEKICFKARYVATGCWPVIQLLDNVDRLPVEQYGNFEYAIGAGGLPDAFRNGAPFYFRAKNVRDKMLYLTYCVPTQYMVEIGSISPNPCGLIID